jgi:hypothetical protein
LIVAAAIEESTTQCHASPEQPTTTDQSVLQACEDTASPEECSAVTKPLPLPPTVQIIGDNVDIRQKPSHQTLERRGKDHHWFHMVAVKDRVVVRDISVTQPSTMVKDLELHSVLPTVDDCIKLNTEFIFLIVRVLTDRLAAWKCLQDCVPSQIPHKYSKEMAMKSEIVCTV